MPELPEVETIRQQLEKKTPFTVKKMELSKVVKSILKDREFNPEGKTISHVKRKGKLLDLHVDDDLHILSHLGMSGGWRISKTKVLEKHTHVQFCGSDKKGKPLFLAYVDPRRFGYMYFLKDKSAQVHLDKLGVDIASDEFDAEYVHMILKKYPNRQLKVHLLDQSFFAGCGNYIASEICARAGIRPTRRCGKVTKKECADIVRATGEVLNPIMESNGLTFSGGYSDTSGEKGDGVKHLVVFWQKECQMCGGEVKKITLAQRGTFYCPKCQK
ncbi:MAG: hypothetical protein CME70_22480 [Halobacteriovorax sp.]|nr:hypothetical protein [Halobacteriovorax sp.]|tara:strand:+ start:75781 stop:76596 length:816 start_codon:yes stop_codon:yes gene_type:complete